MKLCLDMVQHPLLIDTESVTTLVVENPAVMYSIVNDIYQQVQGEKGKAVLSIDDKLVSISSNVEIISDFISFESNKKSLLTKILKRMEETAQDENYFLRTHQLMAEIEQYLNDLSMEQDVDLVFSKLSLSNLLKAVGIRFLEDYTKIVDKIFSYINLVRRFEGDKLFVLVNLHSYVSNEDMNFFMNTLVAHGLYVLFIDNKEYPISKLEKRTIIDADLCEI